MTRHFSDARTVPGMEILEVASGSCQGQGPEAPGQIRDVETYFSTGDFGNF
ncbi:hypothetical protein [Candidatus Contubernalis alkaliaceticus]|uniref:hypothetical protein n=1 Tax=Candidatus Contubernalis alkaliaceticus TaxID=338645 RepID=UPI001F4BE7B7|nr:hypothetical protein [Candidatus Contubernalis alkalaceticus]UNC93497.1 hypothetical protein HUE98_16285 [Candidatus Contubernalis alkalaceticus]